MSDPGVAAGIAEESVSLRTATAPHVERVRRSLWQER